jgi:hypothetical protein
MDVALGFLLAQGDTAEEGLHIITGMLIVGLVFVSVILLGELGEWLLHRRGPR